MDLSRALSCDICGRRFLSREFLLFYLPSWFCPYLCVDSLFPRAPWVRVRGGGVRRPWCPGCPGRVGDQGGHHLDVGEPTRPEEYEGLNQSPDVIHCTTCALTVMIEISSLSVTSLGRCDVLRRFDLDNKIRNLPIMSITRLYCD